MLKHRFLFAFIFIVSILCTFLACAQDLRAYQKQEGYQYFSFGSYPQTAQGEKKTIVWRVLDVSDGIVYALSDLILDVHRIDGQQWIYKGWTDSELFAWLNNHMFHSAFNEAEQNALHRDENLGVVSIPSVDDIRNPAFGFADDKSRQLVGTDYALSQGLYRYSGRSYSPIWTRTASQKSHAHRSTKSGGSIGFIGVESDDLGIIPVIWLTEDAVSVSSGAGTFISPYVLAALEVKR